MDDPASYTIEYDPKTLTATVRFNGPLDAQTNIRAFEEVIRRFGIERTHFLWDLRQASFSSFTLQEIKKLRDFRARHTAERTGTKSCALIDHALKKTLMDLYDELNAGVEPKTLVFFDEAEARAYLGMPPSPPLPLEE